MESVLEKISDINNLVLEGKAMEAFEKYYHEDVVMQENDSTPTVGKHANRTREVAFFANIESFRGAAVLNVTAPHENLSVVVWHYDYTHKEWGVRNYHQLSVQHWKDGKIIKEQFIYNN
jgi:hypothetical protein